MARIRNAKEVYDLPGGWTKERRKRKEGPMWDAYLFAPDGTKLRSNKELLRYVTQTGVKIDPCIIYLGVGWGMKRKQETKKSTQGLIKAINGITRQKEDPNADLAMEPEVNGMEQEQALKERYDTIADTKQETSAAPKKTEAFRFTIKHQNYLERQHAKLPYPKPNEFAYLAKQLKVGVGCVKEFFNAKNTAAVKDSEGK